MTTAPVLLSFWADNFNGINVHLNVGYSLPLAFKDVQLILQSSSDVRAPLTSGSSLRDKYLAAIANKLDTKDCISIYEITRMFAGMKKSGS